MITIKSTTSQLIEALRKAQETINETRNQLEKIQPHPKIGDIWKDVYGESVIVISTSPDTRILSIETGDWVSIDWKDLRLNYERVGTVQDLTFRPGDTGPIEKDKDLPKFRPFDEQDWSMFAGATAFGEGILPHILELDWALIIVDKTGVELYPRADLTDGDPECWRKDWKSDTPTLDQAITDGLEIASKIKDIYDLRQQNVLEKII